MSGKDEVFHFVKREIVWYIKPTFRLEAISEKGPRNHFRGDGMLEDVTHASSLV